MQVTDAMLRAAANIFCEAGLPIHLPQDGDLDDVERERYEALRAAIEAALAEMWQSMDSAPKDGTPVLLGWELLHPLVGHCEGGRWGSLTSSFGFEPFNNAPTAWMPPPPPPRGR